MKTLIYGFGVVIALNVCLIVASFISTSNQSAIAAQRVAISAQAKQDRAEERIREIHDHAEEMALLQRLVGTK